MKTLKLNQSFIESGLTPRQIEAATGVLEGLTNKEIGARMSIQEPAVKQLLTQVFKKTKCGGRKHMQYVYDPFVNPRSYIGVYWKEKE